MVFYFVSNGQTVTQAQMVEKQEPAIQTLSPALLMIYLQTEGKEN